MRYLAVIHKDSESEYGVSFPDFPGCITAGKTLDEARDNAIEAISGHIGTMLEFGEPVPDPSPLERIVRDDDDKDAIAYLIVPYTKKESRADQILISK